MNQNDALQSESTRIRKSHDSFLDGLKKKYIGRDASVIKGKYAGRPGQITEIIIRDGTTCFQVQPYSKIDGTLLWVHPKARTFWPVQYIVLI